MSEETNSLYRKEVKINVSTSFIDNKYKIVNKTTISKFYFVGTNILVKTRIITLQQTYKNNVVITEVVTFKKTITTNNAILALNTNSRKIKALIKKDKNMSRRTKEKLMSSYENMSFVTKFVRYPMDFFSFKSYIR